MMKISKTQKTAQGQSFFLKNPFVYATIGGGICQGGFFAVAKFVVICFFVLPQKAAPYLPFNIICNKLFCRHRQKKEKDFL